MLRRFAQEEAGSIGAVLALGSVMLLGAVSASLDYTRMTNTRTSLAAAVDAAALAGAQAPPQQASAVARQVLDANFRNATEVLSFSAETVAKGDDSAFRVEATANVQMTLSQMVGFTSAPVRAVSEVMVGDDSDVLAALVLDVTGSMAGQKLLDLKYAAAKMVNTLYDKLPRVDKVRISVVPFSEYVNVGVTRRHESWLSVAPDTTTKHDVCWQDRDVVATRNCRTEYRQWTSCNDGICRLEGGYHQVCDYEYGPTYQRCEQQTTTSTWHGCVGSREYPLNARDENYTARPVPGLMNAWCPPQITPLTPSRTQALTAIGSLSAGGETYIPAGLLWGWATLSSHDPFVAPTHPNRRTKRYVILMSDGENTRSQDYIWHWGRDTVKADKLTAELCANIKAAEIEIFTIAFQVNTDAAKNLLRNCATSSDSYFDASDATKLAAAFDQIGQQIAALRIVR